MQTESNILKLEDYRKIKKKTKKRKYKSNWGKMYVALYKHPYSNCIQGWGKSKKEFLDTCVSMTKQLLDQKRPEYFFDCFQVKKNELKKFRVRSVIDYGIKKQKQKLKQKEKK